MGMSMVEYAKLSDDELLSRSKLNTCPDCGIPLQETLTGCRPTVRGHVCTDCYFIEMGDHVDSHPIGIPRMHRGA